MIPTPDLSHLKRQNYEHVYEPAEDTFILLDALEQDADELRATHPTICLELGSGSGCVSSFVSSILGSSTALYLCIDINRHAALCTAETGQQNNVTLESVLGHLATPFAARLASSIDILLFNPPYVPTTQDELLRTQEERSIGGAWAGGDDGMAVTEQLLPIVALLSPNGVFYLVAIKQNGIPSLRNYMLQAHGLTSKICLDRRAGREHLYVLRFSHKGEKTTSPSR